MALDAEFESLAEQYGSPIHRCRRFLVLIEPAVDVVVHLCGRDVDGSHVSERLTNRFQMRFELRRAPAPFQLVRLLEFVEQLVDTHLLGLRYECLQALLLGPIAVSFCDRGASPRRRGLLNANSRGSAGRAGNTQSTRSLHAGRWIRRHVSGGPVLE